MILSIHQPNFIPWAPFFEKMDESDVFVIMNHCKFSKNGYQNRFNVGDQWYTMGVSSKTELITEKRYINYRHDWNRIAEAFPKLKKLGHCIGPSLCETNGRIIRVLATAAGMSTKIVEDYPTGLTGTERLVDICKHYGATKYLSGISGKNYLDVKLFEDDGIEVIFQDESKMTKKPLIEMI